MFAWLEEVGHLLYQDATALLNQTKPNYKKYVWTKHLCVVDFRNVSMNLYSPFIVTEHIAYWKKLPFFTTLPRLKNWLLYPIWSVYTFFY